MRSFLLGSICVFLFASLAVAEVELNAEFEQHIRPILVTKCLKCHGESKQEANLRLDSREAILAGGESGPAIHVGDAAASLLVQAIRYEGLEMPPQEPLTEEQVARFETWIKNGAVWPQDHGNLRPASTAITEADRQWWAYQPVESPSVPVLNHDSWSRNPIDRFVLNKLRERGMSPAPVAEPEVLVRRLYLNLLGLPPTPSQLDEFLRDASPDRWNRLVDKLLSSPSYGEHWGRHWLDLVRFAESDGWNQDAYRPNIWRYRDYVVASFNDDKPYPEFVREQLAGDEIEFHGPDQLVATGYLRLGIYEYNQRNARGHWNDILNELTDVTSDVFLGMGMACARCHDHKFDPLLQTDYFQLRAFFEPLVWRDDVIYATPQEQREHQRAMVPWQTATEKIRQEIDQLTKPYFDRKWKSTIDKFPLDIQACIQKPSEERTSWEHQMVYLIERQFYEEGGGPLKNLSDEDKQQYEKLKRELDKFAHLKPKPLPDLMTATDSQGPISPTSIPEKPELLIEPGFLTVVDLKGPTQLEVAPSSESFSSGRRLALAEWITRDDNPLTPRVIVNRIWQQHFGQGIVASASNFGRLGSFPSHPELLDWLTADFVENGWNLKRLHRLILESNTWRQAASHPLATKYEQDDPSESLLWRAPVRRLTAEQIRDAMLLVTGELQRDLGGPSESGQAVRRALYIKSFRNNPDDFLHAFDKANGLKSESQRNRTTTAVQSLLMVNGSFSRMRAEAFAQRLAEESNLDPSALVNLAVRLAWGRLPTEAEQKLAIEYIGSDVQVDSKSDGRDRWVDFCHVLLNSSEFIYVD